MSAKDNKRDLFVDAVKGIGIISIVIGHASWDISLGSHVIHAGPFVYLYHLAVFAFCTGYLFKPDIPDIWSYVGKKAKGLYRPFLLYSLLYSAYDRFPDGNYDGSHPGYLHELH